ncbi:MAG TPA: winged helix DNA-binding protein [Trueperaceae bacterium]|nr:winged helix DNA-binding protein [Trueperaceae bacterium]
MFRFMRVQRQVAERTFAPLGLRPVQAFALALVGEEATYPKELAHQLDAPPSVISVLIGDLEERGLLTRALDPSDRRRVRVELTPGGRRTLGEIQEAWLSATADSMERLSTEDLVTLVRIQKTLLDE